MRFDRSVNVAFLLRGQLRAQEEHLGRDVRVPRRRRSNRDGDWKLSDHVRHVLLIIYTLTTFASRPAVVYLRNCGRSRHWQERSDEELVELVLSSYRSADADELARFLKWLDRDCILILVFEVVGCC